MKIKIQISIILLVILTGIVFFIWNRHDRKDTDILEEIRIPVTVTEPLRRTLERRIHFRGFVESDHTVSVYPQTMGVITSIRVEEGQKVTSGQIITILDNETGRLNLNQAEAAYKLALDDLNRYKIMYDKNLISQQQFQNIETNFKAKQAQFEMAGIQNDYSRVKSPMDGVVQSIAVEPGALVSSQVALMSISARDTYIIKVDVPEKYYEFFIENTNIPVEIVRPDYPSRVIPGTIQYISPFISPGTMKFQITIELDDSGILIPGMYVEAGFILERKTDLLALPYSTLTRKGEFWTVDEKNIVHSHLSEQIFNGDDYFAINENLKGKMIIIEGQHFLNDGQIVRIVNRNDNS